MEERKSDFKPCPANNYLLTNEEVVTFKEMYSTTSTRELSDMFRLSHNQVNNLGCQKFRLKKVKGLKRPKEAKERYASTQVTNHQRRKFNPLYSNPVKRDNKKPGWVDAANKEAIKYENLEFMDLSNKIN
tara:strand:+ start:109 stop:498 length:390 start_codon:yes stop_codon:yes gene_type:complete